MSIPVLYAEDSSNACPILQAVRQGTVRAAVAQKCLKHIRLLIFHLRLVEFTKARVKGEADLPAVDIESEATLLTELLLSLPYWQATSTKPGELMGGMQILSACYLTECEHAA